MSLPERKAKLLREFVGNICEDCGKEDMHLQAHRMKRGNDGGRYIIRNIKMVCSECHKLMHAGEIGCLRR